MRVTEQQALGLLMLLSTACFGQKQKLPVIDSSFAKIHLGYWTTDINGVTVDSLDSNNLYYICEYKRVDSGIVFITSRLNELFIFNNRKLIRKYHSQTKIELPR